MISQPMIGERTDRLQNGPKAESSDNSASSIDISRAMVADAHWTNRDERRELDAIEWFGYLGVLVFAGPIVAKGVPLTALLRESIRDALLL